MTRKDFQLIASTLADIQPARKGPAAEHHALVIQFLASSLATTNPRFDRDRFVDVANGTRMR